MYCKACGSQLREDAAFCSECGTPCQPVVAAPSTPPAPPNAGATPAGPPVVTKKFPAWLWIVLAAGVVMAVVAGATSALVAGRDNLAPGARPGQALQEPTTSPTATTSPEPEPAPEPDQPIIAPYAGMPITTPQKGEADRTALMDAARTLTGSGAQFLVWQLYVQGDSAVGDIQEFLGEGKLPGRRWLVTWERSGGSWAGRTYVPFLDAVRADVIKQNPFLAEELTAKVTFVVPALVPSNAKAAASKAQHSEYGAYDVWVPTRVPEGFKLSEQADLSSDIYWTVWSSGNKSFHVSNGWGDHEIGSAEDVVSTPAHWGSEEAWFNESNSYDMEVLSYVSGILEGDIPEHLVRAVGMSLTRVAP